MAYKGIATVFVMLAVCALRAQPINDAFAQAREIAGVSGEVSTSNIDATREAREPTLPGKPVGHTIWFKWTAPGSGYFHVSALPSAQSVVFGLYRGEGIESLELLSSTARRLGNPANPQDFIWKPRADLGTPVRVGATIWIAADTHEDGIDPGHGGFVLTLPDWGLQHAGLEGTDPEDASSNIEPPPPIPGGAVAFRFDFTPAPANDDFAAATTLSGLRKTVSANNTGATVEPDEVVDSNPAGGSSIWYEWSAPVSGRVVVGINAPVYYAEPGSEVIKPAVDPGGIYGAIFDYGGWDWGVTVVFPIFSGPIYTVELDPLPVFYPILSVRAGAALAASQLVGRSSSEVAFDAVAGRSYHIAFEGFSGTYGDVTFYVTQTPPPSNDDRGNALAVLDASEARLWGYFVSATREADEINLGPDFDGPSVWYKWIAPTFGAAQISGDNNAASHNAASIAVFYQDNAGTLRLMEKSTSGILNFYGDSGVEYLIRFSTGTNSAGAFSGHIYSPQLRFADLTWPEFANATDFFIVPHVAGVTTCLLRKEGDQWMLAQVGKIYRGRALFAQADFLHAGDPVRVLTLDEPLASPRLVLERGATGLVCAVYGIPGQKFVLSTSTDLSNWTAHPPLRLTEPVFVTTPPRDAPGTLFYRVSAGP